MNAIERRRGELRRGPGRTLRGTVMQYGDVAEIPGIGRERFAVFAFDRTGLRGAGADTRLNVMHDRALTVATTGRAGSLTAGRLPGGAARWSRSCRPGTLTILSWRW